MKMNLSLLLPAVLLATVAAIIFAFAPSNVAQAEGECVCPTCTCPTEEAAPTLDVPNCEFQISTDASTPMVGVPVTFTYSGGQQNVAVAWFIDGNAVTGLEVPYLFTGMGKKTIFMMVERRGISTTCYETLWVEMGVVYQGTPPIIDSADETEATEPASQISGNGCTISETGDSSIVTCGNGNTVSIDNSVTQITQVIQQPAAEPAIVAQETKMNFWAFLYRIISMIFGN